MRLSDGLEWPKQQHGFHHQHQQQHHFTVLLAAMLLTVVALFYTLLQCGFKFGSNRNATIEFNSKDSSNTNVTGANKRSCVTGVSNEPGAPIDAQRSASSGFINYFKNVEKFPFKSESGSPTCKTNNTIFNGYPSKTMTFFPLDSYSMPSENDPVDTLIKIVSNSSNSKQPHQPGKTKLATKSKQPTELAAASSTPKSTNNKVAVV